METTTTSRRWRALLLGSVAACAACGLVYELALLALSASLGRGDVVANSLIVAGYVAALGFGAVVAKPFVRRAAVSFLGIECALGLLGGVSATALYWVFSVTGESLGALVAATFIIGTLVGAEVPLLMTLLQTGRTSSAEDTGRVLANLNAADYFGALVGGLIWPFVLLPTVGMLKATAIAGLINVTAALVIAALLLKQMLSRRALCRSCRRPRRGAGWVGCVAGRNPGHRGDRPAVALRPTHCFCQALEVPGHRRHPIWRGPAALSRRGTAVLQS